MVAMLLTSVLLEHKNITSEDGVKIFRQCMASIDLSFFIRVLEGSNLVHHHKYGIFCNLKVFQKLKKFWSEEFFSVFAWAMLVIFYIGTSRA